MNAGAHGSPAGVEKHAPIRPIEMSLNEESPHALTARTNVVFAKMRCPVGVAQAKGGKDMPPVTQFQVVENSGPNNLRDRLVDGLKHSAGADIAVAFLTRSGLAKVQSSLEQLIQAGRQVRLVTGLYQGFTEPNALRRLHGIQKRSEGRLQVQLSRDPRFHRKMYLLPASRVLTAWIGSSNLTKEGLESGGELNVELKLAGRSDAAKALRKAFTDNWRSSVPLSNERIETYERLRSRRRIGSELSRQEIKAIVGAPGPIQGAAREREQRNWRLSIAKHLKDESEQVVDASTDWDARGWDYVCTSRRIFHAITQKDRLLLFDFVDERIQLVEVKARTEIKTVDGRYYVAHAPIRGFQRKNMTAGFWRSATKKDLIRSERQAKLFRQIDAEDWQDVQSFFRRT